MKIIFQQKIKYIRIKIKDKLMLFRLIILNNYQQRVHNHLFLKYYHLKVTKIKHLIHIKPFQSIGTNNLLFIKNRCQFQNLKVMYNLSLILMIKIYLIKVVQTILKTKNLQQSNQILRNFNRDKAIKIFQKNISHLQNQFLR